MAFSDSVDILKDAAADAVQSATQAAVTMAHIAKYKMQILAEQEKIRKAYQTLGKVYYKDYITDEEPDEAEYKPACEKISECFRRINRLRDAIAKERKEAEEKGEPVVDDEPDDALLCDADAEAEPEKSEEPEVFE